MAKPSSYYFMYKRQPCLFYHVYVLNVMRPFLHAIWCSEMLPLFQLGNVITKAIKLVLVFLKLIVVCMSGVYSSVEVNEHSSCSSDELVNKCLTFWCGIRHVFVHTVWYSVLSVRSLLFLFYMNSFNFLESIFKVRKLL